MPCPLHRYCIAWRMAVKAGKESILASCNLYYRECMYYIVCSNSRDPGKCIESEWRKLSE